MHDAVAVTETAPLSTFMMPRSEQPKAANMAAATTATVAA